MKRVVTAEEMRAFERERFADGRANSLDWMERAALGADAVLRERYAGLRALVVCGGGNNGGDGLALLRILTGRGADAEGALLADPERLKGDARTNWLRAAACGVPIANELTNEAIARCGVLVDALFGTGLSRPVAGAYAEAVEKMNASGKPILAVDLPSGVEATTGAILGACGRAETTVTFQFYKRGQFLFPGRSFCGETIVWPLTDEPDDPSGEGVYLMRREDVARLLPPRPADSHKGRNGRALLCVGSARYTGAALLCAGAALRTGAGLVTAAVPGSVKQAFSALPEACASAVNNGGDWDETACGNASRLLEKQNAVCAGCGAGDGDMLPLIRDILQTRLPAVLDADALNRIAVRKELLDELHDRVVLTPHVGEMARLTGESAEEILSDPVETARRYAKEWNCVVLLKGATSCISDGRSVRLNTTGNPGLAKGGSGDVLAGMITALLAQGLSAFDAACAGAYLLGVSADEALLLLGTRMLTARDVIDAVRQTLEQF